MNRSAGKVSRREVLQAAAAGLMLGVSRQALSADHKSEEKHDMRPNIIFAIADDWSYPHASIYGDKVIETPVFDKVAREGVLFTNAFCAAPTCTASRGAVLTGQDPHRLEECANLWSILRKEFDVYPGLLESAGYFVGCTRKGWGPGSVEDSGRDRNPAGPSFKDFAEFIDKAPQDKPFCFWFGSYDPHRPYEKGIGAKSGLKAEDVDVPPFLPDTPEVRDDLLDYYHASKRYDGDVGEMLDALEKSGRAENTIVVITGDNGLPFPRAKTTLYDSGTRMPLAIRWPARVKGGRCSDDLIGFVDFAPTFLEAAGIDPPKDMTGKSFLDLLTQGKPGPRDAVFTERERHTCGRKGCKSYPCRAVRTKEYLYIRNLRPDLWPAGDPDIDASQGFYSDSDAGPTKTFYLENEHNPEVAPFFRMAYGKRPAEELYDIAKDPWQLNNVADSPDYAEARQKMRAKLDEWMQETGDRRAAGETDFWDTCTYYGK